MLMPDDERPEPCIYTALVPETPRFLFSGFSSRARLSARMSLPQSIDATVSMLIRIHDSAMGSFVSHTARRGSTYCMYQAALTLSGLWLIEVRFITFMRLAHSRRKKRRHSCAVAQTDLGAGSIADCRESEVGWHGIVWYLNHGHPCTYSSSRH
jgi:hypothetical protein